MDLSVIVVNWNVMDLLRDCLKSVYAQSQGLSMEVFVVDNNSSDGSAHMVKEEFPSVRLIENDRNLGFATANNQAIRQSAGRHILLLNPDTLVLDDALAEMVGFMESHSDAGVAGATVLNPDGTVQLACGRHFPTVFSELCVLTTLSWRFPRNRVLGRHLMSNWSHRDTRQVEVVSGACMMVRRQAIDEVGMMDERMFLYAEEPDWCYRMIARGWKVYLDAGAAIIHYASRSTDKSSANVRLEGFKSMHLFFVKHYGQVSGLAYRVIVFVLMGLRIPVHWVKGRLQAGQPGRVKNSVDITLWAAGCRR